MKKQLRFLMLTLLCAVFGTVWGESKTVTMTSFTEISGDVAGDDNVRYEAQQGTAGTAPAIYNNQVRVYQNGGIFKVTAKDGVIIKSVTLGSAMKTTVSYKIDNGTPSADQSISANGTFTLNDQNCTEVSFTCTGTTSSSRLYVNELSVTYETQSSSSAVETTTSITAPSSFNTDLAEGTAAGQLSASVTANGSAIAGAAVTWSSTNTNVATVDNNGNVTLVAVGSAYIKASYAGVTDQYTASEATYTVNVTNSNQPAASDVTFYIKEDKSSGLSITKDGVTMSVLSGTLSRDDNYRVYANSSLIFSASVNIVKIVFTVENGYNNLSTEDGTYNSSSTTWTGNATSVTFNTSSQTRFTKAIVTLGEKPKAKPDLAISDVVLDLGKTANLEVSSLSDGDITFEYSTQGIATIEKNGENYTVSTTSAGTTTVTAVQAATEAYASETVTFTVKVNPVKPEGALFYETFSSVNGAGGRDDNFGETSSSSLGQANTQNLTDEENWIFYDKNGNAGNYKIGGAQCVKIGNTTDDKKLETRSINLTGDGVLTFNAAGWNKNTNNLKVTATGGTLSGDTQVTLTNSAWNAYTVNITGATGNLVLTFEGCCGFIDDILVMPTTTPQPDAPVIWMTYSSNNCLDFTNATDYTAFVATNYKSEEKKVVLTKIKQVPDGVGIVIRSNDPTVGISSIFSEDDVLAEETDLEYAGVNMLVGMPNGGAVSPEGLMAYDNETPAYHFVLAKRDGVVGFYKLTAGNLRANRAYLQIPKSAIDTESSANGISFAVEGEETAIQGVTTTATTDDAWYTLQGVRVAQPTRGLYIHNGKKVVVK